jgi:hypothetical protein
MLQEKASSFRWVPGQGPDPDALLRMSEVFPKPKTAMGEAWFMGERRMFPYLLENLETLSNEQVWKPLDEWASGPGSFGPLQEWTEWYHYLLPRVLTRDWKSAYDPAGLLVTCFVGQHPKSDGPWPYPGFRRDALTTLGRYHMSSCFWSVGAVDIERCLKKYAVVRGTREWYNCGGSLSASLLFCLKYLSADEVASWFESVIAIEDPHWIQQMIVWLIGVHPMLTGQIAQPADFPEDGPYRVSWDWSHALKGNYSGDHCETVARVPFLPVENGEALIAVAQRWDVDGFFEELFTDPKLEAVAAETPSLSDDFQELYGG